MPDYQVDKTLYTENLSIKILADFGILTKKNNTISTTAVDLVTEINSIKIDVQYSQNFGQYGDLRLDFVSAYSKGEIQQGYSSINIFNKFESKYGIKVNKVGKYFQEDYLDAVIILFYKTTLNIEDEQKDYMPDYILLITKKELLKYLNDNTEKCLNDVKLNKKEHLGDSHGSAFLPINVKALNEDVTCYFGTPKDLKAKAEEIKKYLGCDIEAEKEDK